MRFKIHYLINEIEDYFIIETETLSQAKESTTLEIIRRGLDPEKNRMWSEVIHDY